MFASLAALALERSELLEREACRARAEELLHAAAQAMTASLELDSVYAAIVEQAAIVSGAPTVMLLRLDNATQTLRVVASAGASERLTNHRFVRGEGMIGAAFESGDAVRQRPRRPRRDCSGGSSTRASARSSTSRSASARGASGCSR